MHFILFYQILYFFQILYLKVKISRRVHLHCVRFELLSNLGTRSTIVVRRLQDSMFSQALLESGSSEFLPFAKGRKRKRPKDWI